MSAQELPPPSLEVVSKRIPQVRPHIAVVSPDTLGEPLPAQDISPKKHRPTTRPNVEAIQVVLDPTLSQVNPVSVEQQTHVPPQLRIVTEAPPPLEGEITPRKKEMPASRPQPTVISEQITSPDIEHTKKRMPTGRPQSMQEAPAESNKQATREQAEDVFAEIEKRIHIETYFGLKVESKEEEATGMKQAYQGVFRGAAELYNHKTKVKLLSPETVEQRENAIDELRESAVFNNQSASEWAVNLQADERKRQVLAAENQAHSFAKPAEQKPIIGALLLTKHMFLDDKIEKNSEDKLKQLTKSSLEEASFAQDIQNPLLFSLTTSGKSIAFTYQEIQYVLAKSLVLRSIHDLPIGSESQKGTVHDKLLFQLEHMLRVNGLTFSTIRDKDLLAAVGEIESIVREQGHDALIPLITPPNSKDINTPVPAENPLRKKFLGLERDPNAIEEHDGRHQSSGMSAGGVASANACGPCTATSNTAVAAATASAASLGSSAAASAAASSAASSAGTGASMGGFGGAGSEIGPAHSREKVGSSSQRSVQTTPLPQETPTVRNAKSKKGEGFWDFLFTDSQSATPSTARIIDLGEIRKRRTVADAPASRGAISTATHSPSLAQPETPPSPSRKEPPVIPGGAKTSQGEPNQTAKPNATQTDSKPAIPTQASEHDSAKPAKGIIPVHIELVDTGGIEITKVKEPISSVRLEGAKTVNVNRPVVIKRVSDSRASTTPPKGATSSEQFPIPVSPRVVYVTDTIQNSLRKTSAAPSRHESSSAARVVIAKDKVTHAIAAGNIIPVRINERPNPPAPREIPSATSSRKSSIHRQTSQEGALVAVSLARPTERAISQENARPTDLSSRVVDASSPQRQNTISSRDMLPPPIVEATPKNSKRESLANNHQVVTQAPLSSINRPPSTPDNAPTSAFRIIKTTTREKRSSPISQPDVPPAASSTRTITTSETSPAPDKPSAPALTPEAIYQPPTPVVKTVQKEISIASHLSEVIKQVQQQEQQTEQQQQNTQEQQSVHQEIQATQATQQNKHQEADVVVANDQEDVVVAIQTEAGTRYVKSKARTTSQTQGEATRRTESQQEEEAEIQEENRVNTATEPMTIQNTDQGTQERLHLTLNTPQLADQTLQHTDTRVASHTAQTGAHMGLALNNGVVDTTNVTNLRFFVQEALRAA